MSQWMLQECRLPDLSGLEKLIPVLIAHLLVGDELNREQGLLKRDFIRLVDKAIREYEVARAAIIAQIQKGGALYTITFTDHFETCVNAINRAIKEVDVMKNRNIYFPIDRVARHSIESFSTDLKGVRNVVEHMDEYIQGGEILAGQPVMLMISDNGEEAVVGKLSIRFADVAILIRRLHQIGSEIAQMRVSRAPTTFS